MMGLFMAQMVLTVSWVHTYVQTHRVAYAKYYSFLCVNHNVSTVPRKRVFKIITAEREDRKLPLKCSEELLALVGLLQRS